MSSGVGSLPASVPITITFAITRREESADIVAAAREVPEPTDGNFAAYLQPNRRVPLTGRIAQVSANLAETNVTPLQQARVDYEYVTSIMKYDKSGTGWGRGDALYACDVRHGNCTDFHSLFIGLARERNPRAVYDWLPSWLGEVERYSRISLLGRVLTPAEFGCRSTRPRPQSIQTATTTISDISIRIASHSRWAVISR
jgi:hypothetical protein